MQHFSGKKNATVVRKTSSLVCCLAITVMAMFLSGCAAAAKNYKFSSKSVTNVSYNPKTCVEMTNGRFKCKDVVFTVSTIEPIKNK